jgi:hypothetical protein
MFCDLSRDCDRYRYSVKAGGFDLRIDTEPKSPAEESFVVGCKVKLAPGYASHSDAEGGPLTPGDIGTLVEDDKSSKPFKIEYNGKTWWYEKPALVVVGSASSKPSKLCPNGHGLEPFVYTRSHTCDSCRTSIIVGQTGRRCQSCDHDLCPSCCRARFNDVEKGSRVVISSTCTDHALLQPGQVGLVVEDDGSGTPFKVSFEGKTRWYTRSELALADTAGVVASPPGGCGTSCSADHSSDGNCLVCGKGSIPAFLPSPDDCMLCFHSMTCE